MTTQMTDRGRRRFLSGVAAASACALAPNWSFAAGAGGTRSDNRLVLMILRGALDGLAAVPAPGDPAYITQRGALAIESVDHRLDSLFVLHPSLASLYGRYQAGELLVLHAVATSYRQRSHFDAQDLLEEGSERTGQVRDGWLNRSLAQLPGDGPSDRIAVALAQNVPLVLRGPLPVSSWSASRLPKTDDDTLQRLTDLYATDAELSARLASAVATDALADVDAGEGRQAAQQLAVVAKAAGELLGPGAARIGVIEVNGWDTHANQGADQGVLANRLAAVDAGLDALRLSLGAAWAKTVVLVVTEFGRTVAVNGTRGTDHGTGTCALLVGGAVAGGRVIADWPGLAAGALLEGRDLRPTLDLRAVCKGVLGPHLGVSERALGQQVFPDSAAVRPLEGLLRA